ncbi:MAG: serine acetyltransferase [Bacteroidales bacterium]
MSKKMTDILDKTIHKLTEPVEGKMIYTPEHGKPIPSGEMIGQLVETIRSVLFPGFYGNSKVNSNTTKYNLGHALDSIYHELTEQIRRSLCFQCPEENNNECEEYKENAPKLALQFIEKLPNIKNKLEKDVFATYLGDPASKSNAEIIFCYPGIRAITNYRIAHELIKFNIPLLPRIITEMAHRETGIDIHPKAQIGDSFVIDHGTGVVIGATCIIGESVKIYQGVTLGAKSFPSDDQGIPIKGVDRHPIVKDNVVIYAEATILGRITIGSDSIIGGNVWLTRSVPPKSRIIQQKAQTMNFTNGEGI